jgi:hypothetical protein
MKSIIAVVVLIAGCVSGADEASDRSAIENTVRAFSLMPGRASLYTSDFDRDELRQVGTPASTEGGAIPITVDGVPGTVVISKEPMGEAQWFPAGTHPPVIVKRIRFVTPDVALVDCVSNSPLIVMKRVGTDWKIASLRK